MATYHIRPRDDGDWEVKKRGASRASAVENSKAAALARSKKIADPGDTRVIHNADGSVAKRREVTGADAGRRKDAQKGMRRRTGTSPFDNI